MTPAQWYELGSKFVKLLIVVLLFCNIATPYYDVIDSPIWLPSFGYKKAVLAIWHVCYFLLSIRATYKFYKHKEIFPVYLLASFLLLIYTSKAIFVQYPDCCRGNSIGARDKLYAITLGYHTEEGLVLFKVYDIYRDNTFTWYRNDTYKLVNTYYADIKECNHCFDAPAFGKNVNSPLSYPIAKLSWKNIRPRRGRTTTYNPVRIQE